ncbi:MAG: glycosyltransferase [Patescibacteria group bacterium]
MKVCYFGIYDASYNRNKVLIKGLSLNGVEVVECSSKVKGFNKYIDLWKKHRTLKGNYEVMVVGYPGFQAMILARLITRKPIVFDAFVSIYDSMVMDRGLIKKGSLRALYFWCLDKISLTLADFILFDTNEHIKYVSKEFGIKESKFKRILVGADTSLFYPREKKQNSYFKVLLYGHFIPLQGIEYVVRAAKILDEHADIVFDIIGDGQEKKNILNLASTLNIKNVDFVGNLSIEQLAERVGQADVCLGIFGKTDKTKRVIPNKVYECVSASKPVITADTPAIREVFNPGEIFTVKAYSPEAIADGILKVKADIQNAEIVAKRGKDKLNRVSSIETLGLELKKVIESVSNKHEL